MHEVETMAYAGETPWHGLGTRVDPNLSPEEMMKAAGLDWTVRKIKAYVEIKKQRHQVGWSALVRSTDDKMLDIVSNDWNTVQNQDAFKFFADFVAKGDMEMHTAGSLKGGSIVWVLAKVNDSFELFNGDKVESYFQFFNPHQFGKAIDIRFSPIRTVCWNTLTLSLSRKETQSVHWYHNKPFDPDRVKELLGIAHDKLMTYKDMASFLGSKRYNKETLENYFKDVFPVYNPNGPAKREVSKGQKLALDAMDTQPGASYAEGSWWQAANASTFVIDHLLGRSNDARLQAAWLGTRRLQKINAMTKAVEYAQAA